MAEGIGRIDILVVIDEILVTRVVRRIDVDEVNLAAMGLFQQLERGKVVAFDQEVDLAAVVDETLLVLRQHRQVMFQLDVDTFLVLLEDESVLFRAYFLLQFGGELQEPHGIGVGGRFEETANSSELLDEFVAPLFRKIAGSVRGRDRVRRFALRLPACHRHIPESNNAKRSQNHSTSPHLRRPFPTAVSSKPPSPALQPISHFSRKVGSCKHPFGA